MAWPFSADERLPHDQASGAMPDNAAAVVRSRCSNHASSVDRTTGSRAPFALTPLIWEHVNPYGRFDLDMNTRLALA
jgi:hypothetical protein